MYVKAAMMSLTVSVPGCHGDYPIYFHLSHCIDYSDHGQGISCDSIDERCRESQTRNDSIMVLDVRFETVFRENVSLNNL